MPTTTVEAIDVVGFAERIEGFYELLEETPIDTYYTYENPNLRRFFRAEAAFADYYASLANQVRKVDLRYSSADEVVVKEFRFDGPTRAVVDVQLVGSHQRRLRFWDIEITRTDVWNRIDGEWVLVPAKL